MSTLDIIKKLCEENKTSISQLEKDLGFSRGYMYKIETSAPSSVKLQKIADYFGKTTDYLLGKEDKETTKNSTNQMLLQSLISSEPDAAIKFISRLCKNQRINNDFTENYVSSKTDIDLNDYLEFENNNKNIGVENILKLLSLFKLDVNYIAGFLSGSLHDTINILDTVQLPSRIKAYYLSLMKYDKEHIAQVINDNFTKKELKELAKLNETLGDIIKNTHK